MEKTLPLYLGPSVIGSVVCADTGQYISLTAKTYASLSGVFRAFVRSSETDLLIGVLAPDGKGYSASKQISKTALHTQKLSFENITYAYTTCIGNFDEVSQSKWKRLEEVPEIFKENNIIHALAKSSGALTDSLSSPSALALPLSGKLPFPRPDVLCLLTPQEINGVLYGIIGISKNGEIRRFT